MSGRYYIRNPDLGVEKIDIEGLEEDDGRDDEPTMVTQIYDEMEKAVTQANAELDRASTVAVELRRETRKTRRRKESVNQLRAALSETLPPPPPVSED